MRTLLLTIVLSCLLTGCGRKAAPIAESKAPAMPANEWQRPRLPVQPKDEETKPDVPAKPKETLPPQRVIEQEPQPVKPAPRPTQPLPVARNPVTEGEMKDIHLIVDINSLGSGQMPGPALTLAALSAAGSPAAKLVASGDIVLTGARQRESCWAYQKGATTDGGWIVTNSGAEQVDAATAKRWLGVR